MPFAETPLRDEYAAAVERMARRTLDALRGAGGTASLTEPDGLLASLLTDPEGSVPGAVLAAARILGPDLFAPQLFNARSPLDPLNPLAPLAPLNPLDPSNPSNPLKESTLVPLDDAAARLLAEARRVFPPPAADSWDGSPTGPPPPADDANLVIAWQDWAASALLARTPYGGEAAPPPAAVPRPGPRPGSPPGPRDWQAWSVRMAQLSVLALPGLDGPVHELARTHTLDLARGTARSMLRRDLRTAARLARWLAWARADGRPLRLEVGPVLERIRLTGDGSARTLLELAIAERLLNGPPEPVRARAAR
ncbi:hypothetical protein ACFV4G_06670 [Kitasatospora sp. NPDC059747]|uniref:hypothetical protein n=1 Tax=Kitasatospora sp. NPDC059747 TaxID=3346930 RepID=UPI0036561916